MATATVKNVSLGKKNAQQIYCMSKSGNVYALKNNVAGNKQHLMDRILKAGVIDTNQWVKVREGEKPLTRDQYLAKHGSLPDDKSYSVTDKHGYPISMAQFMGVQA